jgi:hypothetical protein
VEGGDPRPREWDDAADISGSVGGAGASHHVVAAVRGPSLRLVAGLVAALVAVGGVLTWGGGGDPGATDRGSRSGEEPGGDGPASGAEMEVTSSADVSAAYAAAAVRLERARTFAYRGIIRGGGSSVLRPGGPSAGAVMVEGAVHLPLSITSEVTADGSFAATETVTSGPVAWSRRASTADQLEAAAWAIAPGHAPDEDSTYLPVEYRSRLGMALVADAVIAAGDRRDAPRDSAGRRVIRATIPDRVGPGGDRASLVAEGPLAGAEVAVTLDENGNIAHVKLAAAAPGHPPIDLELDILNVGEPLLITPADLEPIGSTVPADALAEVGLGSAQMPGLPPTWVLTSATVFRRGGRLSPPPAGCGGALLALEYHDLRAVGEGELRLSVWRDGCGTDGGMSVGTAPAAEFAAGRFTGSIRAVDGQLLSRGVADGATAISFTTDLSRDATAAALASLSPAG